MRDQQALRPSPDAVPRRPPRATPPSRATPAAGVGPRTTARPRCAASAVEEIRQTGPCLDPICVPVDLPLGVTRRLARRVARGLPRGETGILATDVSGLLSL